MSLAAVQGGWVSSRHGNRGMDQSRRDKAVRGHTGQLRLRSKMNSIGIVAHPPALPTAPASPPTGTVHGPPASVQKLPSSGLCSPGSGTPPPPQGINATMWGYVAPVPCLLAQALQWEEVILSSQRFMACCWAPAGVAVGLSVPEISRTQGVTFVTGGLVQAQEK